MSGHLRQEIELLKRKVLYIGSAVEYGLQKAIEALDKDDTDLAQEVVNKDDEIDRMEVELEEDCLKVLALHQPVAIDLRFIIAVLKINNDLERIGDLAANIAGTSLRLIGQSKVPTPAHLFDMAEQVKWMVNRSLDALVNMDTALVDKVLQADDLVDDHHKTTYTWVEQGIQADAEQVSDYVRLLGISKNLERIADHATNIAEDVKYMIVGDIVRHNFGQPDE